MDKKKLIIGIVIIVLALGMISSAMSKCSGEEVDPATGSSAQQEPEQQDQRVPDFNAYVGMNAFAVVQEVQAQGWSMEFTDTAAEGEYRDQTQFILDDLAQSETESESLTAVHYIVTGVLEIDANEKTVTFEVLSKSNAEAKGISIK